MKNVREKLHTPAGKIVAIVISLAGVVIAIFAVRSYLRGDTPESAMNTTYICSETGKSFVHRNALGETIPILSPYSRKNTGYPAEACYWNADGTAKTEPTWVLLNEAMDKPGPTFCPDCGRLVTGHNRRPRPDVRPPPMQSEYAERHAAGASAEGN